MAITETNTTDGSYTVRKFTGNGAESYSFPVGVTAEILVVAGGGGCVATLVWSK
jgi:hypothetical protein